MTGNFALSATAETLDRSPEESKKRLFAGCRVYYSLRVLASARSQDSDNQEYER